MKQQYLQTGKIVSTHGVHGEVKLLPWADSPECLLQFHTLYLDGKEITSAGHLSARNFTFGDEIIEMDGNEALKRICPRIDLNAIQNLLENTSVLEPVQKEFYLTMLTERKEKILDYSLELLMRQEQQLGFGQMNM